jgi:hypothetical protein
MQAKLASNPYEACEMFSMPRIPLYFIVNRQH